VIATHRTYALNVTRQSGRKQGTRGDVDVGRLGGAKLREIRRGAKEAGQTAPPIKKKNEGNGPGDNKDDKKQFPGINTGPV
jgi:hypothetical protein